MPVKDQFVVVQKEQSNSANMTFFSTEDMKEPKIVPDGIVSLYVSGCLQARTFRIAEWKSISDSV
jgi:hypothetical protein